MSERESFDAALDAGVETIAAGSRFDHMLAVYPQHREPLRPLLQLATQLRREADRTRAAVDAAAVSPRLQENYAAVHAALRRAQMHRPPVAPPPARPAPPWWRQRIAAVSMPAAAVVLVGVLGLTGTMATVATIGRPAAIDSIVPGGSGGAPFADQHSAGALKLSGIVSDVRLRDGSFRMFTGDRQWLVVFDATTEVDSPISAGAPVTVEGQRTDSGSLRASSITRASP